MLRTISSGHNQSGEEVQLPFTVTLKDFALSYYDNELVLEKINQQGGQGKALAMLDVRNREAQRLGRWKIKVREYLPEAVFDGAKFVAFASPTAVGAVDIEVSNQRGELVLSDWLSSPGRTMPGRSMDLGEGKKLRLWRPKVREYLSLVEIAADDKKLRREELRVNHPISVAGWRIYQSG